MHHKRHGKLDFYFAILFLNYGKDLESCIFGGIKTQIFGDKKDIFSVSYLAGFGFLVCNSLRILKSYGIVSLTLKTSPDGSCR